MQPTTEAEPVLVTILVTDIVGSTERASALGDRRWRQLLEAHHARIRQELARFQGREIDTAGDGFLAAFDSPARAIRCARAIAEAVPELGIAVRAAVHCGECEWLGERLAGIAVHVAVRIAGLAAAGEVLVSSTVRDLLAGSDLRFADRGVHPLKGIPDPWRVFAVEGAAAGGVVLAEAPPREPTTTAPGGAAAAVAAPPPAIPHNLPQQLTSFVGREREMAEVRRLLGATRLLTLTGAGGLGKTRLALQVAATLLDEFPDGVWLVELAALTDPALVPQTVAAALGVREEPRRPLAETLAAHLRDRRALLLLDNCEHLVGACAALADALLRACSGLRILATSREALGIAGETAWRVPPLSLPRNGALRRQPRQALPSESVTQYEAVRLFIERATAALPTFAVTNANAPDVAQICHRLDGIPLAIELAAARVKVLTVEQINSRLDDRFRLLTGGSRTALPRQQTLRALVDWSYDLLAESERVLLRRLAVFAGVFTLEAAEAVGAGDGVEGYEVLDLLSQLVDKSLVVVEEHGAAARYRLLETIREYSAEILQASGEAPRVRARHRDWYTALAERAEAQLQGPEQAVWLARLEDEHDNLRAALECCRADPDDAEAGLRLAGRLWRFWYARGYVSEGRACLESMLARSTATAPAVRAAALNGACALAHSQGDLARAEALAEEALALRRQLGDRRGMAGSLNNLGLVAQQRGDHARAVALHEEALALRRELGDRLGVASSLNNLGLIALQHGDHARAAALHEESLALKRELGDERGVALSLNNLGLLACAQGDYGRAAALLEESLARFRALGDTAHLAAALNNLGEVVQCQGDLARAAALHEEALVLRRELKDERGVALSLANLGLVAREQGDYPRAGALYRESLALHQETAELAGMATCLERLAALAGAEGMPEQAARLFGAAEALREALGAPLLPADRAAHERQVAAVREALGDAAFAAAWSAGRTQPTMEAIAQALAAPSPTPAS